MKKNSLRTITRSFVPLFVCMVIFNFSVSATTLAVPIIVQAKSCWCWAACAEMVAKYENCSPVDQASAVYHIFGTCNDWYPNTPGNPDQSALATEYITNWTSGYNYNFSATSYPWSYASIVYDINHGHPVQTHAGYYNNGIRTSGHAVVIIGVYTNSTGDYIVYIDPDPDCNDNPLSCKFSKFCDGSFNGRIYDATIYYD